MDMLKYHTASIKGAVQASNDFEICSSITYTLHIIRFVRIHFHGQYQFPVTNEPSSKGEKENVK